MKAVTSGQGSTPEGGKNSLRSAKLNIQKRLPYFFRQRRKKEPDKPPPCAAYAPALGGGVGVWRPIFKLLFECQVS